MIAVLFAFRFFRKYQRAGHLLDVDYHRNQYNILETKENVCYKDFSVRFLNHLEVFEIYLYNEIDFLMGFSKKQFFYNIFSFLLF